MNAKEIADKIYDDVRQKIFEWKQENAVDRNNSTAMDYIHHSIGATKYSENLLAEITNELIARSAEDGELNETTYVYEEAQEG